MTDELPYCAHCDAPFSPYESDAVENERFCCSECEGADETGIDLEA